jgi:hypothetical protein
MADWRPELAALAGIHVLDLEGRLVELASLWRERCVVVAFLRHFGCILCRQRAALLDGLRAEIRARGAGLVLIGSGTHTQAREFAQSAAFAGELYVDPKREAFQALGLHRSVLRVLDPRALWRAAAARRAGFRGGPLAGDPWQQGGTLVVGPGNRLHFAHRDRRADDHARTEDLLGALARD